MSKQKRESVLVCGANGRMGKEICALLDGHQNLVLGASADREEIKAFDKKHTAVLKPGQSSLNAVAAGADVIIDFSTPSGTKTVCEALKKTSDKTVLIGTTGLESTTKSLLKKVAKTGAHKVLLAGNTSLGIYTLARLAFNAAKTLAPQGFDIEITETHHRLKADAPSGTALLLADVVKSAVPGSTVIFNRTGARKQNSIGIQSIRGGGVFGEHEIRFISDNEEICLSHRAFSRALFAKGALNLALEINQTVAKGECLELSELILRRK